MGSGLLIQIVVIASCLCQVGKVHTVHQATGGTMHHMVACTVQWCAAGLKCTFQTWVGWHSLKAYPHKVVQKFILPMAKNAHAHNARAGALGQARGCQRHNVGLGGGESDLYIACRSTHKVQYGMERNVSFNGS
jgi:hypothetical protein